MSLAILYLELRLKELFLSLFLQLRSLISIDILHSLTCPRLNFLLSDFRLRCRWKQFGFLHGFGDSLQWRDSLKPHSRLYFFLNISFPNIIFICWLFGLVLIQVLVIHHRLLYSLFLSQETWSRQFLSSKDTCVIELSMREISIFEVVVDFGFLLHILYKLGHSCLILVNHQVSLFNWLVLSFHIFLVLILLS